MKNKHVGYLIIAIALVIGIIIYLFNRALTSIVAETCTHGPTCTMWSTIDYQTYISLILMFIIFIIGIYMIFFNKDQRDKEIKSLRDKEIERKEEKENMVFDKEKYEKIVGQLKDNEEKQIYEKIIEKQGSIYQSVLVSETTFSKVKVTRILDRLEGKHLIERKRRGMTNIILLK